MAKGSPTNWKERNSLAVQGLELSAFKAEPRVQSLVGELWFQKPCQKKNKAWKEVIKGIIIMEHYTKESESEILQRKNMVNKNIGKHTLLFKQKWLTLFDVTLNITRGNI